MRMSTLGMMAAASAALVLAACSGNGSSAISPMPGSVGQARTHFMGRSTSVLPPSLQRLALVHPSDARESFDSCPATGTLVYGADYINGLINIYDSTMTMCGQLAGLNGPQGMTVASNHDLLVANTNTGSVLRFHRGATTPYRTYTDPGGQFPTGVTVQKDKTVVVANIIGSTQGGSISTFLPNGHFVGNFIAPGMSETFFITNLDNGGPIFADGFDTSGFTAFWTGSCPLGACTGLTEVGEAMSFPGGVADTKSSDVIASDQTGNTADTFEFPSLTPVTFSWDSGGDTDGIDNSFVAGSTTSQIYGADAVNNEINCYSYKQSGHSTGTCGTGLGNSGGEMVGAAADPGQ